MSDYIDILQEVTNNSVAEKIVQSIPNPLQLAALSPYALARKSPHHSSRRATGD